MVTIKNCSEVALCRRDYLQRLLHSRPRVRDAPQLPIPAKLSALIHSVTTIPYTSYRRTMRFPSTVSWNFADAMMASAIFRPDRLNAGVSGAGSRRGAPGDGRLTMRTAFNGPSRANRNPIAPEGVHRPPYSPDPLLSGTTPPPPYTLRWFLV